MDIPDLADNDTDNEDNPEASQESSFPVRVEEKEDDEDDLVEIEAAYARTKELGDQDRAVC